MISGPRDLTTDILRLSLRIGLNDDSGALRFVCLIRTWPLFSGVRYDGARMILPEGAGLGVVEG